MGLYVSDSHGTFSHTAEQMKKAVANSIAGVCMLESSRSLSDRHMGRRGTPGKLPRVALPQRHLGVLEILPVQYIVPQAERC